MIRLEQGEIPRDRWGRPVLGGKAHTRASTLAKALDDTSALTRWSSRMTAVGLAASEDLVAMVATTDPEDRTALDRLVETAKERAASSRGANLGTAIHAATEVADAGLSIAGLPSRVRDDVEAYLATIGAKSLEPLAAETFVVCEQLGVAGTFDRLYRGPNRVVIGDLKTSGSADTARYAALSWSIQLAVYARSLPWLPDRGPVPWVEVGLPEPDRDRGLVVHIVQGTGQVRLYSIDLVVGWQAAQLAAQVRDLRGRKNLATAVP